MSPKIGLIATINNSGLGQMAKQFHRNVDVYMHFVIPHHEKGTDLEFVRGDYIVADQWDASLDANFRRFLASKPDIAVIFEYPYNWHFLPQLKAAGIKIVWFPMIDSVGTPWIRKSGYIGLIDLFVSPSQYCHNTLTQEGLPSVYLPWPIDTEYFAFTPRGVDRPLTFLHNIGHGGDGMRKGWDFVFQAWRRIDQSGCRLIVHSQIPVDPGLLRNVDFRLGNFPQAVDLYKEGDVYLSPSRREGLGLPFREAMSCGIPVIGSNIPPLNEVIPDVDWLVEAPASGPIGRVQNGLVYQPNTGSLMMKMLAAKACNNLPERSSRARAHIERCHSWTTLGPIMKDIFEAVAA